MALQFARLIRVLVLLSVIAILQGCAGTSVVSRFAPDAKVHKLTSARIVWIDNPAMPINVTYRGRGYIPRNAVEPSDLTNARKSAERMFFFFRKSAVPKIKEQFAQSKVSRGNDMIVVVTPALASNSAGGERSMEMNVALKPTFTSKEVWSTTIESSGSPWEDDRVLLDKFVATLIAELKNAGWLN